MNMPNINIDGLTSIKDVNSFAGQLARGEVDARICDIIVAAISNLPSDQVGDLSFDVYVYMATHNCDEFFRLYAHCSDFVTAIDRSASFRGYQVLRRRGSPVEVQETMVEAVADGIGLVAWAWSEHCPERDVVGELLRAIGGDEILCARVRKVVTQLRRNPPWRRRPTV